MMSTQNTMNEIGVELEEVVKKFDDVIAVDGVDLTVEQGELVVLLGPSGCGKSTTLRMIAGLEVPTSGAIRMKGEDVTETLPQKRDVSMVFQNYALYPHKSVEENLRFPLGKMDLSDEEKDEKVAFVTELLDIEELLDKQPDMLSGGQRQRVALGRTIVREPALFLMDEPLSNLDAELRVSTRSELRQLQQELGTTTVYVTHDQEEAMSIADRIAIMDDGVIQQIGTPEEVYTNPANQFVASFLGEPGMNFLPATTGPDGTIQTEFGGTTDLGIRVDGDAEPGTVGIRPQDIHTAESSQAVTDGGGTMTGTAPGRVLTIDPLGHGYEFTLGDGTHTILGLSDRPPGKLDESVSIVFDSAELHVFAQDGSSLPVRE